MKTRRNKPHSYLTPDAVLSLWARWITRQLQKGSQPGRPLLLPASRATLAGLRQALRNSATPVGQAPEPQPDTTFMMRSAARSTQIVGHILDTISDEYGALKKPAAFMVRMGRIAWAVVEAAIPRSIPNLLMHYWFSVLLIVEIVMITGGTLIGGSKDVQGLGVKLLVVTLVFRALVEATRLFVQKKPVLRLTAVVVLVVASVFVWLGTIHFRTVIFPGIEKRLVVAKNKIFSQRTGDSKAGGSK